MILLTDLEELALTRFLLGLSTPEDRSQIERLRDRLGKALDGRVMAEAIAGQLPPLEPA